MDEVDNKYIEGAIADLAATVGIKEPVNADGIISLVHSKKIKEAVKEIAEHLGLPIDINLSYVPKGYRPSATDGFQSTHLVKTDWRGRGTAGITAQVSVPSNLPLYGTPGMTNFPIRVRVSEDCGDHPATFIGIMAHELSHIVLYSMWHKEKENEFYTDLTAMMLGFAEVVRSGRKVVKTDTKTERGFLSSETTTTTQTTTYGYLSDENFIFASDKIAKMLKTCRANKNKAAKRIKAFGKKIDAQKRQVLYFKKYLSHIDKHLDQKISPQDARWMPLFHQVDYADEFESAARAAENEVRQFTSFMQKLDRYNNYSMEEMNKCEKKIAALAADLNSKHDKIRGAVIILKKYVPLSHRLRSFIGIRSGKIEAR